MPFFGSSLNVGAMVEPLTPQMADFLGVRSGIMVRQVARKSEAAAAGLKAHDVIIKVGNEAINTTADWDRALRSNQSKPVQVTILRDRKQQVVNLQVDSKHNKSEVDYQDVFPGLLPDGPCPLMAALDPAWGADAQAAADKLRQQAEEFRQNFNPDAFKIDPKEMEEIPAGHGAVPAASSTRMHSRSIRSRWKSSRADGAVRQNFNSDASRSIRSRWTR